MFFLKKILLYLKISRPISWTKNIIIFAPLFFIGRFFELNSLLKGLLLFITFCFLASTVYIINDIRDWKEDALHQKKNKRPIAQGKVKIREAIILASTLFLIVIFLSLFFPLLTKLILLFYFVLNLFYTFIIKNLPLLDIFTITTMYLIRIYAGGTLFQVEISHWLILCTFFLALFLISAKRRAELYYSKKDLIVTRRVLNLYSRNFLDHLLTITTTATLVSYGLYVTNIKKPYLLYSIFIVAFGILRYLYLIYQYNLGESPEIIIFKDIPLIMAVLGWVIYLIISFYLL